MTARQSLEIIVVEDNLELQAILVAGLRHFGHNVRGVNSGSGLDAALATHEAHIVILDLGLPGEDGIAIATRLKKTGNIGIIMVSARGLLDERVQGLESGADIYFVKPVDIRELDAAVNSLHRRISATKPPVWHFNSVTSILTTPRGAGMPLTAQECILMKLLLVTPGNNVSRSEIFRALNQPDDQYADKRLEAMISRLRTKLKAIDQVLELPIRARHNLGYAFLAEAVRTP